MNDDTFLVNLPQEKAVDSSEERMELYLLLGHLLFKSGATAQRIVDSIARAAELLGERNIPHVLVEYDALIIESGSQKIRMHQSKGFAGIDVAALTAISRLLRKRKPGELDAKMFKARLMNAVSGRLRYTPFILVFAAIAASIGFDLLNGADLLSLGAIIPAAVAVYLVRLLMLRRAFNFHAATLVAVLAGGLVAALGARLTGTLTPEVAFIAPMLFLVPGVPMINGGVDLMRNHNGMGLARIVFTALTVSMIALGLAFALSALPLPSVEKLVSAAKLALPLQMLRDGFLGALAAGGLAMLNNAHRRTLLAFILCGFFARAVRAVPMHFGIDIVSSTLIAAVLSTIVANRVAAFYFAPGYIMSVVAVLSMVPGLFAIQGLNGLFAIASGPATVELLAWTAQALLKAVFISAALTAGIIIPALLLTRNSPRI